MTVKNNTYSDFRNRKFIVPKYEISQKVSKDKVPYYDQEEIINNSDIKLEEWIELRKEMSITQWMDFLLVSLGYNCKGLFFYEKLFILMRLLPFCVKNYHLMELGAAGTGKSFTYEGYTKDAVITSGSMTLAEVFGSSKKSEDRGLIVVGKVLALDELAEKDKFEDSMITKLRSYLSNGNSSRDDREKYFPETSVVFLGNLKYNQEELYDDYTMFDDIDLFEYMPKGLNDNPIKDRINFMIPGWFMRKTSRDILDKNSEGINLQYLFDILLQLREKPMEGISELVDEDSFSTRGKNAIIATIEGLVKLLYPHENPTISDLEALKAIAKFGKKLVDNEFYNFTENQEYKHWILEIISNEINPNKKIEKAYSDLDRIFIKYDGDTYIYKVALTIRGEKYNTLELENYKIMEKRGVEEYFLKTKSSSQSNHKIITQDYREPLSNKGEIKLKKISHNFSNMVIDYDSIEDLSIKKIFKTIVTSSKAEINELQKKNMELQQEVNSLRNEIDSIKEKLDEQLRKITLDFMELTVKSEKNLDMRTEFLTLKKEEEKSRNRIDNLIEKFKQDTGINLKSFATTRDYAITEEGELKVINYYKLDPIG